MIYILKNENQKLKDKINEMNLENETSMALRRKQMSEQSNTSNEKELLLEKVRMLMEVSFAFIIYENQYLVK